MRTTRRSHRHLGAVFAIFAITTLAACQDGDAGGGNAERFCGEIEANQAMLTNPGLSTSDQVGPLLDLYREIGAFAPIAIAIEWQQLVLNYETASTVAPGDDASMQRAVATALQSEQAAAQVKGWLVDNCALDIGPVATIAPQGG
ncbi:MAG: hypothetical protein ACJAR2_002751 [Ilumatobacter sp.]|jgi:hypothetical protein